MQSPDRIMDGLAHSGRLLQSVNSLSFTYAGHVLLGSMRGFAHRVR
jgi:hypothetical protein